MSKKNDPIGETWEEITRRHEKGELIRVEKVEVNWKKLFHAIFDLLLE